MNPLESACTVLPPSEIVSISENLQKSLGVLDPIADGVASIVF